MVAPIPGLRCAAGIFLLVTVGWAPPVYGQDWSAQAIIDLAVARAEEQRLSEATLEFEALVETVTEHLDGDGAVKETERETYRQYPLEGVVYEELIARDGEPLDAADARSQRERRERFVRRVRERRANGEDPRGNNENRVEFNEEFISRYDLRIVGAEEINGHMYWVIALAPRAGDLPVRRRIDHALNNSTGRIWVNQDDHGLVVVEFEMAKSVRFWGGILGTLRNTVGRLEFTRVAERVWLPTTIDIKLDLRIVFRSIRRRFVREWADYAPFESAASSVSSIAFDK